ncbi:MAG: SDR family oxidoreductase [candidate division NC10 bacterium]|nr:SDR family oxidoreductase [candidate division NC10 bacterium]
MRPARGAAVLLTGATGFIGRAVARRLLAAGRPVVALARRRGEASAAARVAEAVGLAPDGGRLQVLEADLTHPGLGLGEGDWRLLRDRVETVIHCAGETVFFPRALEPFVAGHVGGPLTLLRGLAGGRLRHWAHLSTAYVCGNRSGIVLEREGDVGQCFQNPYERVKLRAEEAVRRAGAALGVDVRVLRPSIVVGSGPETAGGHPSQCLFAFIRMAAALAGVAGGAEVPLRIAAAPRARFNIVPVDYVAEAARVLAEHPEAAGGTFHLVVSDPPTQAGVLAMIAARLGLRGLTLVDARRAPLGDPSPLEQAVARHLEGYRGYLDAEVRFDDTNARRILDRCGLPRPRLSRDGVHRLVHLALATSLAVPRPVAGGRDGPRAAGASLGMGAPDRAPGENMGQGRGSRVRTRLARIVLLAALLWAGLALSPLSASAGESPLVAELREFHTRYHEDPARLDALREGLERAAADDPSVGNLLALAQVSFIWGDIRAETREAKLTAYDRGREAARRAVDLEPQNLTARFWYATNTARWGQAKGVLRSLFLLPAVQEEIGIILELDPAFAPVYALAGNVFYEVPRLLGGDLEKAEAAFQRSGA